MEKVYSKRYNNIIGFSREEAQRTGHREVIPEHLLLGIIREGSGSAIDAISSLGADINKIKKSIDESIMIQDAKLLDTTEIGVSSVVDRILKISNLEARLLNSNEVDSEHILLAMLKESNNNACKLLEQENISYGKIYSYLVSSNKESVQKDSVKAVFSDDDYDDMLDKSKEDTQKDIETEKVSNAPKSKTPVLDSFGIDITKLASEGKLDPVIGRDTEIERLSQILSRRKKNNPVLIGEPGVGKSAIVEGLAIRIVKHNVSRILFNKRVVSLDMAAILSGTKYRGQFEERIKTIISELSKNKDIILFIDEIHTIVGAGSAPGTLDAANILKPALARGEIQCIGATTLDEYRKSIEKDGALERRFQKIIVNPTTEEETLQILRKIKGKYEEYHNVSYTDEALEACVKLTSRYITDRNFPDKAIDALDEAGSKVHITDVVAPKELEDIELQIQSESSQKLDAVKNQDFELAAKHRDAEKRLRVQLKEIKSEWEDELKARKQVVDVATIDEVVAMMSGIPLKRVAEEESHKLINMSKTLQESVIGQNDAIDIVVKAIRRNRVGLKNPQKPIGVFMFLGPTGVGKTYLAKKLAESLFDSQDALIRIDMSEYMEKFSVSRLIGAPPGYVGYEEGGQLTERVRRKPYSVVLLDEIEKANTDVFNLLLQVMDEGRLTDSLGRFIDFKNTIIIMTSNIGTKQLKEFGQGVGFTTNDAANNKSVAHSIIKKALNKYFAPEFLNRLDDVVIFDNLNRDSIFKIIDLELKDFCKRLSDMGYMLSLTDKAKEFIADAGCDVQYGARPLKRAIQQYLEDEIAELMLSNELHNGDTFVIDYDDVDKKIISSIKR
ncbi:MAG: ATP-dependent Clp protease ATP-binding subunit [Bacteroidales bacterium]|nr:ATP-dependent Clp protease ATP-binding subunit [Bacteroidales bacterium]